MDANDKIALLARQSMAQCRRNPRLEEFCTLMRPTVRLLAEGQPVTVGELAGVIGWPEARVARVLRSSPDAEWTPGGLISGMCVTLRSTPHRLTIDGRTLNVWCAFCALVMSPLLGKTAHLESSCMVTGTQIEIGISPTGFAVADPVTAVIAVRGVAGPASKGVVPTCVHQGLFRDVAVTARWLDDHPNYHVLSVSEAGRYARLVTSC